ncbi:MAG TPA: Npt1/Npt2 family nucleotide transporter [Polyangiaceae bacterium]|jgi:AAA family ATP:ADP antiporter
MTPSKGTRLLSFFLRPFAKVEPGEALSTVALTLTVFLLLTAYYLLKTAREPLILLHGGAEVKSYAAAGQAALLLVVVRLYGEVATRVGRLKLLTIVYLFFVSNLLIFAACARAGLDIGVPFFLWVGVFNYTAIAQFWAFAADMYGPEQGKRLFPILGIGSSVGAVAGARIAKSMVSLGPPAMMVLAGLILVVCVAMFAWVDRTAEKPVRAAAGEEKPEEPLAPESPFHLVLRDRYLLLVAGLTLVLNWCNANGEYILDRTLLASVSEAQAHGMTPEKFVGAFKAEYFAWVSVAGVVVQMFLVSRILTRFGVRNALLVMPIVTFTGYTLVLFAPVLALIRVAKVAENSLDYSLQNTARQALYLVTSRAEKYAGKTLVDTFVVRAGDMLSAGVVLLGSRIGVSTQTFAALNLVLVTVWIVSIFAIGKENDRRAAEGALVEAEPLEASRQGSSIGA